VVSADEKTSIQAYNRCQRSQPAGEGRPVHVEHEYERKGTLAYLAAWDVHRARLFGCCETKNGIEPFERLVEQVMREEPYASADRVFWVVDNGSSHRRQASVNIRSWASSDNHTLKINTTGTKNAASSGKRVNVDALVALC
jgi:DDE superfamily endonuclease